ncbi:MAG: sensor histidine kinase [Pseudonocardiaceae bacterium]
MTTLSPSRIPAGGALDGDMLLRHRGSRWRLRDWRLRTKLTAVLLVPLLLAGVLGVLRITDLMREADELAAVARQIGFAQQVSLAAHDLQGERQLMSAALAADRFADRTALQSQTERVDAAATIVRTAGLRSGDATVNEAYQVALGRLAKLAALRQSLLARNGITRNPVIAYADVIAALLDLNRRVLDGARDQLARQADGVKALGFAKEQASQQHAVLLAAILSGVLPAEQQAVLRIADARFDAAAGEFDHIVAAPQIFNSRAAVDRKRLLEVALQRAGRAAPLETSPGDWNSAAAGTVEVIRQAEIAQLNELRTATAARSNRVWNQALGTGAVVAALLILAVVMLLVVVRSLVQPLRTLRTAAFDVADRKLPEAVGQLRSADGKPGQTTVDPVPVHSREEVGQVARAVDTVHAQAVRLASEQAVARTSLTDTLVNLSGRNQDLVARQRRLIGELRSTAHGSELLSSVVQLDQLAVRMRRHSDNLLVLAGGKLPQGGAAWLAVLDLFRSAVSEVEQQQRVTTSPPPAAMVAGQVVNDLVHLIAELLDNAIRAGASCAGVRSAGPQEITVTLSGTLTADDGLLVEIIDSGPGLPPDELRAINARLVSPPVIDALVSRQMGLFVVSRLAALHGITVRLRQRPGQVGMTAAVSLAPSLVSINPVSINPESIDAELIDPGPAAHGSPGNDGTAETTEWSGIDGQLPLQVSVVDDTAAADLFSPASIDIVTSQRGSPRSAEQQWQELFGDDQAQPDELSGGLVGSGLPIVAAPGLLASPPGSTPVTGAPEVREEIFEMVSAWFREQQSTAARSQALADTTEILLPANGFSGNAPEWRSPLDEGWQAARALHTPVDHGVTQAGLPKRQPLAHLVAGADSADPYTAAPLPAGPPRNAAEVRGRLSRYQHGLRIGRHARVSPDEPPAVTDTLQGRLEEDQ